MSIQTGSFHTVCRGALGYELKGLEGNMQCLSDTVQTIRLFSNAVGDNVDKVKCIQDDAFFPASLPWQPEWQRW